MDNINKSVGRKIKKLRKEQNLTQEELASLVYSSQPEIYHIETGQRTINVEKLLRFSKALKRDVVYFLSDYCDNYK